MKARYLSEQEFENPLYRRKEAAAARHEGRVYSVPQYIKKPAGFVVSNPEAFKLVRMGVAEPADEECELRCGMNKADIVLAAKAQEKVALGISPEDYDRYDRGEMRGYNPDGSDIHGPTWAEFNAPDEEPDEDDYDVDEESKLEE